MHMGYRQIKRCHERGFQRTLSRNGHPLGAVSKKGPLGKEVSGETGVSRCPLSKQDCGPPGPRGAAGAPPVYACRRCGISGKFSFYRQMGNRVLRSML